MKINVQRVLQARKQKSWSQEELAIASGLNLRTIQRIESEGSASLQSRKALASALNLDIQDLENEVNVMPQQWEYMMIETKDKTELQHELNRAGKEGWELVTATSMFNTMMTRIMHTLFLKRPVA
jgi:transcriptional regulator with XRE-family HTH domain